MKLNIMLEDYAYMPVRAHNTDAGLDIKTPISFILKAHSSIIIDTGIHVELPENTGGLFVSKSGLNVIHDITSTGLVDYGFTGILEVKLYNHGNNDYSFNAGDKITQLVIFPITIPEDICVVDRFNKSDRGDKKLGLSGR